MKNISTLTKFLYQDAFHGLFKRPFFQKKRNRYLLLAAFILLYLAYFYVNMVAFVRLSEGAANAQPDVFALAARTTLSSCYNTILIFSVFIFTMVNANFSLSRNSLFFIKTLPFKYKEILLSLSVFRLSVGIFVFELILAMMMPILRLLSLSVLESLLALLTFHLLFFTVFQLLELIYSATTRFKNRFAKYLPLVLDGICLLLSGIHFTKTRFIVDYFWATQKTALLTMMIYALVPLLCILVVTLFARWHLTVDIAGRIKSSFIHVVPKSSSMKLIKLPWMAVLRFKITSYYAVIVIGLAVISIHFSGWNEMLQNMLFVLPLIGLIWTFYADALLNFRPLFNLYRISIYAELCAILLAMVFILLPSLIVGFVAHAFIDPFLLGLGVSLASLTAGFLFPKSQGNMNESLSAFLSIIMMMLLASLISIPSALYIVDGLLLLLVGYILNKERKVKP
ncbi:MAG: hypothetical protein ABF703_05630 [Oenococcus sp.]|uniref:hypothetical protein n=2 Tax=Lactobacillaceae TaxID=33958 RepID=UPI0021E94CC9|nr:hypothetical protein [Oenococcus kitaharae]MCV3296753.1 hypothetical protein [Oenococcus kitaharae]